MNQYAIIAGIFVVGILIIGAAAFGLFNQVNSLEKQNTDLNVNLAITSTQLTSTTQQVADLSQTVTERNNQIGEMNASIAAITSERDVAVSNYNASQAELADQKVLMEQTMLDNNDLKEQIDELDSFFYTEFDLNVFDDNFSSDFNNYYITRDVYDDFTDFFKELRNDFGYCYWAVHCPFDANGCNAAYDGPDLNELILQTIFVAACENVSDEDYNKYAAVE